MDAPPVVSPLASPSELASSPHRCARVHPPSNRGHLPARSPPSQRKRILPPSIQGRLPQGPGLRSVVQLFLHPPLQLSAMSRRLLRLLVESSCENPTGLPTFSTLRSALPPSARRAGNGLEGRTANLLVERHAVEGCR